MSLQIEGRSRLSAADYEAPPISTWRAAWLLIRSNPWLFAGTTLAYIIMGLFPIGLGALIALIFDQLTGVAVVGFNFQTLVAALLVIGLVGTAVEYGTQILFFYFGFSLTVLMRKNMMARLLELPGAQATITSPGEMISRFSGDARNVRELANQALQTTMHVVVILVGLTIMLRLQPLVTAVVFLPLIISSILVNALRKQIGRYRAAARGRGRGCDRLCRRNVWRGAGHQNRQRRTACGSSLPRNQRRPPPGVAQGQPVQRVSAADHAQQQQFERGADPAVGGPIYGRR
jgi:ABC-type multidrug transport system fused ATPase/permease subunit